MSAGQPSVTLHVSNLPSKVKKDETRRTLYALFSSYGKVLDVVHTRSPQQRGTAFVVFRDLASSTAALRGLDGEAYYGKQLRIAYAKSTSYATVALAEGPEAVYQIKLGLRTADGKKVDGKSKMTVSAAQRKQIQDAKNAKRARDDDDDEEEDEDDDSDEDGNAGPEKKKGKMDDEEMAMEEDDSDDDAGPRPAGSGGTTTNGTSTTATPASTAPPTAAVGQVPNPILFVQRLPAEVTSEMLLPLFQQYPGLVSVKLLPLPPNSAPNSGTGFVQYESVAHAQTAKDALDQFLLAPQVQMSVDWAQR